MDAAEIATFRALLQAQSASQAPSRSWFRLARRQADPVAPATSDALPRGAQGAAPLTLDMVMAEAAGPAADPLPARPPRFGRRDEAAEPPPSPTSAMGEPATATLRRAVMLFAPAPVWEGEHSTPDIAHEPPPPVGKPSAPSSGVIAGWSRARPPSAQRRILARLEAVFLVEREGLDSRREAAA